MFQRALIKTASQLFNNRVLTCGKTNLGQLISQTKVLKISPNLQISSQNSFSCLAAKSLNFPTSHQHEPTYCSLLKRISDANCRSQMVQQQRTLIKVSMGGKFKTSKIIVTRFRRLGNGLWIRRQSGFRKRLYTKMFKKGGKAKILKKKRHVICDLRQSRLLEKMVGESYKKQKWYVADPYKGYTDYTQFWYHPLDLPNNSSKLPDDYYKYGLRKILRRKREVLAAKRNRHQSIANKYYNSR